MNTRRLALAAAAIAGALGLASCGGTGEPSAAPGVSGAPVPASPAPAETAPATPDAGLAGGAVLAGDALAAGDFVGKPLEVASSWAEENGRPWRVGRQDGVDLPVSADLVPGRVTFTVEDGIVTAASIEQEDGS